MVGNRLVQVFKKIIYWDFLAQWSLVLENGSKRRKYSCVDENAQLWDVHVFSHFAFSLHFLHKVKRGNVEFYFLLNPGVNDSLLYLMYFSQTGQSPCHHLTLQTLPWPPPWQQLGLQQWLQLLRGQQRQMQMDQQGRPWPVRKSNQYFSFQFALENFIEELMVSSISLVIQFERTLSASGKE